MKELLRTLVDLPGPCGYEQPVIKYLYERLKGAVDECYADGIGNLIAVKKGAFPGPVLTVSAHSDEVGFIVKRIDPNGLIRFEKLGGHDDRILLSQQVLVNSENGQHPGVIGTISAHMVKFDDPKLVRGHRDLYIDVGASDAAEVAAMGIKPGDCITYDQPMREAGPHRVYGHAFDDRAGCAVLAHAFETIDFSKVHGTLVGVFSVQEELGLRGAHAASSMLKSLADLTPDVALAVDTTAVGDTPEVMMDHTLALGAGTGIKIMDFSMVAAKTVWSFLEKLAVEQDIPHQMEIFVGIGTDAGALHMTGGGVPTGCISVPTRYAHSCVEMMDLGDFEASYRLLEAFVYAMKDKEEFSFI